LDLATLPCGDLPILRQTRRIEGFRPFEQSPPCDNPLPRESQPAGCNWPGRGNPNASRSSAKNQSSRSLAVIDASLDYSESVSGSDPSMGMMGRHSEDSRVVLFLPLPDPARGVLRWLMSHLKTPLARIGGPAARNNTDSAVLRVTTHHPHLKDQNLTRFPNSSREASMEPPSSSKIGSSLMTLSIGLPRPGPIASGRLETHEEVDCHRAEIARMVEILDAPGLPEYRENRRMEGWRGPRPTRMT